MEHVITVAPSQGCWAVRSKDFDNEMLFLSAERAEAAARALARRVADAGRFAAVEIWLRDGRLAGRLVCGPGVPIRRSL